MVAGDYILNKIIRSNEDEKENNSIVTETDEVGEETVMKNKDEGCIYDDDFIYEIIDDTVIIAECKSNAEKATIPAEVEGKKLQQLERMNLRTYIR